jgi:hypothetical protein
MATIRSIRDNGIELNAVESASASVAVGAIALTVRHSNGCRGQRALAAKRGATAMRHIRTKVAQRLRPNSLEFNVA